MCIVVIFILSYVMLQPVPAFCGHLVAAGDDVSCGTLAAR